MPIRSATRRNRDARPRWRWLLILVIVAAAAPLTLLVSWFTRDPSHVLPLPAGPPSVASQGLERRDGRMIVHLRLADPAVGEIGLAVSLPDPLPPEPLPIVLVLGGLGRGADNIKPIERPGANAVVGYDWPLPIDVPDGLRLLPVAPELAGQAYQVPGQVVAALDYLSAQPWADGERVSLLGFSLGALATPAVQAQADRAGHAIGWTVLAYGGAPMHRLLAEHPMIEPAWLRPVLGLAARALLRPVEPLQHLPSLEGSFLVLHGTRDRLIPGWATENLLEATPEPRTVRAFDGDHMGLGPDQRALLAEIMRVSRAWLVDQGAVGPRF